jgi:Putative metal-binding motif
MPRRLARRAIAPLIVLTALVAPATASAWTVTIHIHGAGGVKEVTNRLNGNQNQMNCFVEPGGKSNASVTDCVGGTATGLYNSGNVVRLAPQLSATAMSRGWSFSHWTDSNAGGGLINCDPQDTSGDFSSPTYCEFQIFANLRADLWFTDSTGPQDTAINGGPAQGSATKQTTATFTSFSAASDPDATFQCKLDRPGSIGTYASCPRSGASFNLTTNGTYTLSVRGVDPSGNVDLTPATRSWTFDTIPPTLTLTGGPAEGSRVSSTSASFNVGTNEGSMTCTLDGTTAGCVNGTKSYTSLAQGAHTFTLAATDAAGNPSSQTRHWTVDTVAPVISITAGPGAFSNAKSGTITFSGNEAATYTCALDSAPASACTGSIPYSGLADGHHSATIQASDAATPANVSTKVVDWTIDTVVPETTLLNGPAAGSTSPVRTATFSFASPESGASFECRIDTEAFAPCSSPYTRTGITNGDHTFQVRAVDRAGNRDATPSSRAWRVNSLDDDADGFNRPQDCNDANPAIHPGAVDIPDDGIDQDCSGADAINLDRDADGFNRPQDCNDGNPAVHPGATDIPGDGIDQDCSGADAPVPPLPAGIAYKLIPFGPNFRVQVLKLTKLPRGTRVKITCTGKHCPVKAKTVKAPRSGTVDIRKALKRKPLFAGSKLRLQASARGYITKVVTFDIRRRKVKGGTFGCVPPGAKKPRAC